MNCNDPQNAECDVAHALAEAGRRIDRIEARILLSYAVGMTAVEIVTYPERPLTPVGRSNFRALVARREHGEPIAYLTGMREFYGRNFMVTPDVLIPRPETELLVDTGLARSNVTTVDRSLAALAVARHNAATLGATLRCLESDWYAALVGTRYHLIVANPPYVAAGDSHLIQGDLRFEPASALLGGSDGLSDWCAGEEWVRPLEPVEVYAYDWPFEFLQYCSSLGGCQ